MDEVTALKKVIRSGFYNPDTFAKRLKELNTVWSRLLIDAGRDDLEPFLDMLEDECAKFLRSTDPGAQKPDGPTVQTVRNLREDPVIMMLRRGTIDKQDEATIQELREFKRVMGIGLTPRGADVTGERVDSSAHTFVQPVERFTARQWAVLEHVWRPWAEKAQKRKVEVGKKGRKLNLSHFDLLFRVIENNEGIRRIEREEKINTGGGDISAAFVNALRSFAHSLSKAEHEGKVPRCEK